MKIKKIFGYIFILLFLSGCFQPVFIYDTPEKAVQKFFDAITRNDYDAAMGLCPAEKIAGNFNFIAYTEWVQCSPSSAIDKMAPPDYALYKDANESIAKSEFALQLAVFTGSFFPVADMKEFVKEADPQKLKDAKLIRIDKPKNVYYDLSVDSQEYTEILKKAADIYGANEMTERIALIEYGGNYYLAGFTLLRYDESWGIQSLSSNIGETSSSGHINQITEEEYKEKSAEK